jgi:hypothetical protein
VQSPVDAIETPQVDELPGTGFEEMRLAELHARQNGQLREFSSAPAVDFRTFRDAGVTPLV